jgi:uncharacterized protein (TIGR02118 family)
MAQPMTKVIAVYRQPKDAKSFDRYYAETHTPLVKQVPGLRRLEVTRITGAAGGATDVYQVAELYFDDPGARETALASKEGKTVMDDLSNFAAGIVTVYLGEAREA